MANSFSFNGVDMSAYGLRVKEHEEPFGQVTDYVPLVDFAYGGASRRGAMQITLEVIVAADGITNLKSYLSSIRGYLNHREDKALALDTYTDRYWMARFEGMTGRIVASKAWEGEIVFTCAEPYALSTTETDNDHTVDEDPETFTETAGGTEKVRPVITLVCDDTLTDTTVEINNETTGETVEWTGDLVADDELIIDCENMIVYLNGTEDMATVSGEFPALAVGANTINISGFSGNCNFIYRARYA